MTSCTTVISAVKGAIKVSLLSSYFSNFESYTALQKIGHQVIFAQALSRPNFGEQKKRSIGRSGCSMLVLDQ